MRKGNKKQPKRHCPDCVYYTGCRMWGMGILDGAANECSNYTETKASATYLIGKMDGKAAVTGGQAPELILCRQCFWYDADCGLCDATDITRKPDDYCSMATRRINHETD